MAALQACYPPTHPPDPPGFSVKADTSAIWFDIVADTAAQRAQQGAAGIGQDPTRSRTARQGVQPASRQQLSRAGAPPGAACLFPLAVGAAPPAGPTSRAHQHSAAKLADGSYQDCLFHCAAVGQTAHVVSELSQPAPSAAAAVLKQQPSTVAPLPYGTHLRGRPPPRSCQSCLPSHWHQCLRGKKMHQCLV